MATKLRLENSLDILSLNGIAETGTGIQVVSGLIGLGLPPVSVQWLEGAGDGATYRGKRVLPRDFDLPLDILGHDRDDLKRLLKRLTLMLANGCTLRVIEDNGTTWSTDVQRIGGGNYAYGTDTIGEKDLQMVLTLRAGDPYFTSSATTSQSIGGDTTTPGFLSGLTSMQVASSQAIGDILLENTGDASAWPVWEVRGPGNNFRAISPSGAVLHWTGTLLTGETLIIDALRGSVVDGLGANRYADLAAAPRFWSIPPGITSAEASLLNVTAASKIVCTWRTRKWMVV